MNDQKSIKITKELRGYITRGYLDLTSVVNLTDKLANAKNAKDKEHIAHHIYTILKREMRVEHYGYEVFDDFIEILKSLPLEKQRNIYTSIDRLEMYKNELLAGFGSRESFVSKKGDLLKKLKNGMFKQLHDECKSLIGIEQGLAKIIERTQIELNKKIKIRTIVTDFDFDGVVCAMLLKQIYHTDNIIFTRAYDIFDKKFGPVNEGTVVADLPYVPGASIWFDHHTKAFDSGPKSIDGLRAKSPSCARVIAKHYKIHGFDKLLNAVDRDDSFSYSKEDVMNPSGYMLIGRSVSKIMGDSNEEKYSLFLALNLHRKLDELMNIPIIKQKTEQYLINNNNNIKNFDRFMKAGFIKLDKNVILLDERISNCPDLSKIEAIAFRQLPKADCSLRICYMNDETGRCVRFRLGKSDENPHCKVKHIGSFLKNTFPNSGAGGGAGAGGAKFPVDQEEIVYKKIMKAIRR